MPSLINNINVLSNKRTNGPVAHLRDLLKSQMMISWSPGVPRKTRAMNGRIYVKLHITLLNTKHRALGLVVSEKIFHAFPYVKLYINPTNHDPGAENAPPLGWLAYVLKDYIMIKSIFQRSVELGGWSNKIWDFSLIS